MPSLILSQAQAEAVYNAMCHLNNVSGYLDAFIQGARAQEHANGVVQITKKDQSEDYDNQAAFASAYGLDEATDRAEMVLQGNHPWIYFANVLEEYGLDDSFVWTASTLSPYVEQYMQAHKG